MTVSRTYLKHPGARLWPRVKLVDSCLEWTGSRNEHGYGSIRVNRALLKTHRFAWQLSYGEVPHGLDVLHRCDNPPCCNPAHLFLGTAVDNGLDMVRKGRHGSRVKPHRVLRGETHPVARLTHAQALNIRGRGLAGESQLILAAEFGVARRTVNSIVRGVTWK